MIFRKFDSLKSAKNKLKTTRSIAVVVNQVKMGEEDARDVEFWLTRTPAERLAEVVRLRRTYYTWLNGTFPEKIERVVQYRKM
jgi:hypothetical protein